jgi:hypothetical protein
VVVIAVDTAAAVAVAAIAVDTAAAVVTVAATAVVTAASVLVVTSTEQLHCLSKPSPLTGGAFSFPGAFALDL